VLNPAAQLDTKPKSIQRPPKFLVSSEVWRADPNDKGASCAQEVDEPVERGLQCFDRVIAPSDHRYIVLTSREATVFCGECVCEAAAAQFTPYIGCCMACHEQTIEFFCARASSTKPRANRSLSNHRMQSLTELHLSRQIVRGHCPRP
jgi:hypothetical protein